MSGLKYEDYFHFSDNNLIAFFIAFLPACITLALVLFSIKKFPRRLQSSLFILDLIFTALWQLSTAMMRISATEASADFWDDLLGPFGIMCSAVILHFSLLFTDKATIKKYIDIVYACYFLTFFTAFLYPHFSSLAGYKYDPFWGWINNRKVNFYSIFSGIVSQAQFFFTIFILVSTLLKAKKRTNQFYQLLLIVSSMFVVIFLALITESVIPIFLNGMIVPITSSIIVLYVISAYIALTRFRMFSGIDALKKHDLLDSISDIIIVFNPSLEITFMNKSGLNLMGLEFEEISGKLITNVLTNAEQNTNNFIIQVVNPVLVGNPGRNIKCHLIGKDSGLVSVLVSSDILRSKDNIDGILLVCRSVSDLEKADYEIRKHTAQLGQLFAASPFAIISLDNQARIIAANPEFEKTFSYAVSWVIGKNLEEILSENSAGNEIMSAYSKAMGNDRISKEISFEREDGTISVLNMIGYPIVIDDKIVGCYILFIDVSFQKKFEEDILEKNRELSKINYELDNFIYSASHDIRSPLMTILGLVNVAKMEIQDEVSRSYLRMIRESALKLDAFTHDIINYSKNFHEDINPDIIDIEVLVREISLKFLSEGKGGCQDMDIEVDPGLLFPSDRQRLDIVLNILFDNAVTYRRPENNDCLIKVKSVINAKGCLEVEITDNGIGIDQNHIHKIFDMFTKYSELSKGSGLGLYIVKEIIEKLGGKISVSSEIGKGSSFVFEIPPLRN